MNNPKVVLFVVTSKGFDGKDYTNEYLATFDEKSNGYVVSNETQGCYTAGPTLKGEPYTLVDVRKFFSFYLGGVILSEDIIE